MQDNLNRRHPFTTMTIPKEDECFSFLQDFFSKIISNNDMKQERFEPLYRTVYILVCCKKIKELNKILIKNLLDIGLYASSKDEHRKKLSLIRDVFMSLEKSYKYEVAPSIKKMGLLTRVLSFQIRLYLLKYGFEKLYYRCFRLSFAPKQRGFLRDEKEFIKKFKQC